MRISNISFGVLSEALGYFAGIRAPALGIFHTGLLSLALDYYNNENNLQTDFNARFRMFSCIASQSLAFGLEYGTDFSTNTYRLVVIAIAVAQICSEHSASLSYRFAATDEPPRVSNAA